MESQDRYLWILHHNASNIYFCNAWLKQSFVKIHQKHENKYCGHVEKSVICFFFFNKIKKCFYVEPLILNTLLVTIVAVYTALGGLMFMSMDATHSAANNDRKACTPADSIDVGDDGGWAQIE
jgi:hypothetical protein